MTEPTQEMIEAAALALRKPTMLPGEIAGLIAGLDDIADALEYDRPLHMVDWKGHLSKVSTVLRLLAQENERLKATDWSDIGAVSVLKQRIRELEAERDAIRRKTAQECWDRINALIKQGELDDQEHYERNGLVMAKNVIRALVQDETIAAAPDRPA